jgi:hypothetical protein
LAAHSSTGHSLSARLVAPVPLASHLVIPSITRGESVGIHCDHCGHDGHVEAFYYMKKEARKA